MGPEISTPEVDKDYIININQLLLLARYWRSQRQGRRDRDYIINIR